MVSNPEIETRDAVLPRFPALQVSQNFHVAVEAGRAAGEMLGNKRIGLLGMFSQADQFGIRRTIESPWVGKGFGKIRLGEAEQFLLVQLSLHFSLHWR
jgi:hypothetical protein